MSNKTKKVTPFDPKPAPPVVLIPLQPAVPPAKYTPLPDEQIAALLLPWDPFNRLAHEAKMNTWLMGITQQANATKLKMYEHSYADWRENAEHYVDLGMAVPPPPVVPVLAPVGPMPLGYWFA